MVRMVFLSLRRILPFFWLQRGYTSATLYYQAKKMAQGVKLPSCSSVGLRDQKLYAMSIRRPYCLRTQYDLDLNRDFFVRLRVADRKKERSRIKRKHKVQYYAENGETTFGGQGSYQVSNGRRFSGTSFLNERSSDEMKHVLK